MNKMEADLMPDDLHSPPKKVGHRFVAGQSGNPAGRKPLPIAVKEALGRNAEKAIVRLTTMLDDDTAWGANGWLDGKTQIKAVEVAIHRAYGAAMLDPRATKIPSEEDGPALLGHVLRQAYDALRDEGGIPEYINARRADQYVDVTPTSDAADDTQLTTNDVPKIDRAQIQGVEPPAPTRKARR